jgi:hypothetical protein
VQAYITGSRAYGEKYCTEESDIDLVIFLDTKTIYNLLTIKKQQKLMFGELNLVVFNYEDPKDMERAAKWKEAHDFLMQNKPNCKEDAIKVFREKGAERAYFNNKIKE